MCFCTHTARVSKLLLWCINTPMSIIFCLMLGTCIQNVLGCVGECVCTFFFIVFVCIYVSKFCSISPVFGLCCCVCPRYNCFVFSGALVGFAWSMHNTKSLGVCLLCSAHAFFLYYSFSLSWGVAPFTLSLATNRIHP